MIEIVPSHLSGCYEVRPTKLQDPRGSFTKVFSSTEFKKLNFNTDFREEYYSSSKKNVVRGMHFQLPPHQHAKYVYCTRGAVIDVVVDLRKNSPTFKNWARFNIDEKTASGIYIPEGFAHGFLALTDDAVLTYKVTSEHSPSHDSGILWSSIGFEWPISNPILSERDKKFIPLASFESPF